ncbi:MAG: DUF2203 domain-containing protein [Bryobacteraceae bacterium]
MPRFFTREQAEETLPAVEKVVRDAIFRKSEYERVDRELRQTAHKVIMAGGMLLDREHIGGLNQTREESAKRLQQGFEQIQELGCQIKDLDIGLLDFPTLYKGEEVCLCWRLGESKIEFWHGLSEGFRGRKQIDSEFLEHHRGDLAG